MDTLLELHIESLSHGGDAVAHAPDGRAVFVRGGCPGDRVLARVTADHSRFLRALVQEVLTPSADRVDAPCPYFGDCGGCQWQHVRYGVQTEAKRRSVADALERIGHQRADVGETVAGERPYGYRNHIELSVGLEAGRPVVGYVSAAGDALLPVDTCLLPPAARERAPGAIAGILRFLSRGRPLGVTRVGIRSAAHTHDTSVDVWTEPGPFPRQLAAKTLTQGMGVSDVTRVMVRPGGRKRDIAGVEVLAGSGLWHERLAGFRFSVSPPSFFQVNTEVAEAMSGRVADALAPGRGDRVLDLYAGVGTFTLPLAACGAEVTAVEGAGHAVRDLRRNLEDNGLDADVVPGDAARALESLGRFDLAVVDPPRAGMREDALAALVVSAPRRIVYVSCNPATLARDASRLSEAGYTLREVTPFDLFPQTYHTEAVAVLDAPA